MGIGSEHLKRIHSVRLHSDDVCMDPAKLQSAVNVLSKHLLNIRAIRASLHSQNNCGMRNKTGNYRFLCCFKALETMLPDGERLAIDGLDLPVHQALKEHWAEKARKWHELAVDAEQV